MTLKTAETLTLCGGQPACKSGNGKVSGNKQEKRMSIKQWRDTMVNDAEATDPLLYNLAQLALNGK